MTKVKLTVVKKAVHEELIEKHIKKARFPDGVGVCDAFETGQEFIVEGFPKRPEGFLCDWAWADIQRDVAMIMFGGSAPWMEKEGSTVTCCTDGLRPVSFLVERLDEQTPE